ncbi:MAG: alpha-ketoacid dehydrogenase subunit beta [Oscillospiraceae bacterium]
MTDRFITYTEAIREAMREALIRDPGVFLLGEDLGVYGGAFGVTAGLLEEFGPERVRDTPISETGFVGAAVGAALAGLRPIVELMFSDFMAVCYDQIINQAAKLHYMSGGHLRVPMVIRTPAGGGTGAAAQHSQSLEAMYCNVPGLKVVAPSTPYDAKGLLHSAILDDNPVIFLEQKLLYPLTGPVPEGEYSIPFGVADIKRPGGDVSVITYGRMVQTALAAAETLAAEGIDAEVLDLRSLSPLDSEAILTTAAKTGRVLVLHEAVQFGGFGGEIAATIAESEVSRQLKTPIKRLGGGFSPVPFSPGLEQAAFPDEERVLEAVRSLMN